MGKDGAPLKLSEGGWLSQHLEFRFLASRTWRPHISVVLRHSVRSTLLQQPQDPKARATGVPSGGLGLLWKEAVVQEGPEQWECELPAPSAHLHLHNLLMPSLTPATSRDD